MDSRKDSAGRQSAGRLSHGRRRKIKGDCRCPVHTVGRRCRRQKHRRNKHRSVSLSADAFRYRFGKRSVSLESRRPVREMGPSRRRANRLFFCFQGGHRRIVSSRRPPSETSSRPRPVYDHGRQGPHRPRGHHKIGRFLFDFCFFFFLVFRAEYRYSPAVTTCLSSKMPATRDNPPSGWREVARSLSDLADKQGLGPGPSSTQRRRFECFEMSETAGFWPNGCTTGATVSMHVRRPGGQPISGAARKDHRAGC